MTISHCSNIIPTEHYNSNPVKPFLKVCCLVISCIFPLVLIAQEDHAIIDSATSLKEVIVTATRTPDSGLFLPYAVSVVKRAEMDQFQSRTTPEALMGLPGVFVQKTNHGGGSPIIRGLTGNQVLTVVDGVRFNNATFRYGPNQYLNTIDAFSVSKIEVARGTGSVQFGSDAMGGVVQVFTKEPQFYEDKSAVASIIGKATSQHMEYSGRAEALYQSKNLAVTTGVTLRKFGDLIGGARTGRQFPTGYSEQASDIKLKLKLNTATLTLANFFLKQDDVPLYHRVTLENFSYYNFSPQQRNMAYAKLNIKTKNALVEKIQVTSSIQSSLEKRKYKKNGDENRFVEEDEVAGWGTTVDVSSSLKKNWTANSGVDYYHDRVNSFKQLWKADVASPEVQRGLYPNESKTSGLSAYSLHHLRINKWKVEGGVRYSRNKVFIPDTSHSVYRVGNVSTIQSCFVGNLGLLFTISKLQSVYASLSNGYRNPNIDDMGTLGLVDFRYEIPAYDLRPEKSYSMEIGYHFKTQATAFSASLFHTNLRDIITRVRVQGQTMYGYNVYSKKNSSRAFIRGAEASLVQSFGGNFFFSTGFSYAFGQNLSAREPMRRIPPFFGRILLNYKLDCWKLAAEALFAGKQDRLAQGDIDDNRIGPEGTPGWNIWNAFAEYQKNKLTLRAAFHNIINKDYRIHGSGINGMGRSVSVTAKYQLQIF